MQKAFAVHGARLRGILSIFKMCIRDSVDLSRDFLNSNGAVKHTDIEIEPASVKPVHSREVTAQNVIEHMSGLNLCSQKGLSERFDSTIGANTVLMRCV